MRVLLLQLDGKLPNLALMRVAAHHRARGDEVHLRRSMKLRAPALSLAAVMQRDFGEREWDAVYASAIFERSRPLADGVRAVFPAAFLGGTGIDEKRTLEDVGIVAGPVDYTDYPTFTASLGFTQRGCCLKCPFCVVPRKEGEVRSAATIAEIWRGEPWPRHVVLLDNDFFGQLAWRERIDELRDGGFRVNFNQGINVRMLNEEVAEAVASVAYYDDTFRARRLYTAWDNRKDEARLFRGLEQLCRMGVKPSHLLVYMLIGYWPGETIADWEHRRARLRAFGAVPYPMPYVANAATRGFYRWVVGAHDKHCTWEEWQAVGMQSRNFQRVYPPGQSPLLEEARSSWTPPSARGGEGEHGS